MVLSKTIILTKKELSFPEISSRRTKNFSQRCHLMKEEAFPGFSRKKEGNFSPSEEREEPFPWLFYRKGENPYQDFSLLEKEIYCLSSRRERNPSQDCSVRENPHQNIPLQEREKSFHGLVSRIEKNPFYDTSLGKMESFPGSTLEMKEIQLRIPLYDKKNNFFFDSSFEESGILSSILL